MTIGMALTLIRKGWLSLLARNDQAFDDDTSVVWDGKSIADDDDTMAALRHVDGITELEGLMQESVEWRMASGDPGLPETFQSDVLSPGGTMWSGT